MPSEATVVLGLHARDGSTQEITTTIPLEVLSDTAALDSHSVVGSSSAGSDVGR